MKHEKRCRKREASGVAVDAPKELFAYLLSNDCGGAVGAGEVYVEFRKSSFRRSGFFNLLRTGVRLPWYLAQPYESGTPQQKG